MLSSARREETCKLPSADDDETSIPEADKSTQPPKGNARSVTIVGVGVGVVVGGGSAIPLLPPLSLSADDAAVASAADDDDDANDVDVDDVDDGNVQENILGPTPTSTSRTGMRNARHAAKCPSSWSASAKERSSDIVSISTAAPERDKTDGERRKDEEEEEGRGAEGE